MTVRRRTRGSSAPAENLSSLSDTYNVATPAPKKTHNHLPPPPISLLVFCVDTTTTNRFRSHQPSPRRPTLTYYSNRMIGNFINIVLPVAGLLGFSTSSFVHYAVDAVLVSVCLSGIKRSTGLSPAVSKIQNKEIRQVVVSYLDVGEWIMDFVIVFLGRSSHFERR
ncbi:hypothetical protein PGT21_031522 [Puccinia graminis f. sp. tritici]|nr:hypothetical protein PGT21_031522 [Puccinia graminis f. sp. tritici]